MPGFDGTGPDGQGSMTGRGLGNCVKPVEREWTEDGKILGLGRGGIPRGGGRGRGRGFGGRRR